MSMYIVSTIFWGILCPQNPLRIVSSRAFALCLCIILCALILEHRVCFVFARSFVLCYVGSLFSAESFVFWDCLHDSLRPCVSGIFCDLCLQNPLCFVHTIFFVFAGTLCTSCMHDLLFDRGILWALWMYDYFRFLEENSFLFAYAGSLQRQRTKDPA